MRIAPVGLMANRPFELGCELAALTHGHPSGFLSAGTLATMISALYDGRTMDEAIEAGICELVLHDEHEEVLHAIQRARHAASVEPATPESVESLGRGWIAEEAIGIAVFCALKANDFASGVLLAVNHSGDSDSTGAITGNLLGTALGQEQLPAHWVQRLEVRELLEKLADDLGDVLVIPSRGLDPPPLEQRERDLVRRYPGW